MPSAKSSPVSSRERRWLWHSRMATHQNIFRRGWQVPSQRTNKRVWIEANCSKTYHMKDITMDRNESEFFFHWSAKIFNLLLSLTSPLQGFIHQKSKMRYELVPSETGVLTSTVFWYPCLNLHQTGVILNSHKKMAFVWDIRRNVGQTCFRLEALSTT